MLGTRGAIAIEAVSENWKNEQRKTLVPESFVEISIKVTDPDALDDAKASSNGEEYFSTTDEITRDNVEPVKYAMCEPGLWILDGTYHIVGGYWEPDRTDVEYNIFIPLGYKVALRTTDGEEVYVRK